MAEHLLSDFSINTDEPENGIRELVKIIKPHWNDETVKMEVLSGGYSSKIYKCFDPKHSEELITVRIRHMTDIVPGMEKIENQTELKVIQYLSKVGHFPKIYAIFANGYCYDYVKGKPIWNIKMKKGSLNEEMLRSIAKEMVYIHELKLDEIDYIEEQYLQKYHVMFASMPFKDDLDIPSKETIMKEFEFIRKFNHSLKMPLVLCHSDCHPGNFVWNDENGKITFVDWEATCTSYQHAEVAYFIVISKMFSMIMNSNINELRLPDDFENKFLTFYFQELCKVKQQKFIEDDFQKFKELVHKCKLGRTLLFVTFPLIQLDYIIDVLKDSPNMFDVMFDSYQNLKEEILGTRKFNAEL